MPGLTELRADLNRFVEGASRINVLVAGDVMLDAYVSGDALRISPEAPVPVVSVGRRRYVAGGAANVASNVRSLGATVQIAGVTGRDEAGLRLRQELQAARIGTDAVLEDPGRITTLKTRVMASGQQIVRFDEEDRTPVGQPVFQHLVEACEPMMRRAHVCVISDYAKGVVSDTFCSWFMAAATAHGKPVVVDPKARDLARYRGAMVITPNLKETAAAAGSLIQSEEDLAISARILLAKIAPAALLVTRGESGMTMFEPEQPARHFPAILNEVADVTGAGDTVVGALAIALGIGFDLPTSAAIANVAAAAAVSHPGTWAVGCDELLAVCERSRLPEFAEAAPA